MLEDVRINCTGKQELNEFLIDHGFIIEELEGAVLSVHRPGELPVFISRLKSSLFFEVDLGAVSAITDPDIYRRILLLNTELLPVSAGIDATNPDDPHLVLIETREIENLDDNELLSVLDAMELAIDKIEKVLITCV